MAQTVGEGHHGLPAEDLSGTADVGSPSDYVFWLKACAKVSVVLAPADLFWYRTHAGQVLSNPSTVREVARVAATAWRALHAPECPLTPSEREVARRNHAWDVAREAWRALRGGDAGLAVYRLRHAGLTAGEWLRYLRRPRRDPFAGTPRDAGGDFLIPAAR